MTPDPRPPAADIWNLVPDALLAIEASGRVAAVNRATLHLFGYAAEELVGRPIECLIDPKQRSLHVSHREDFATRPRHRPMGERADLRARTGDGRSFVASVALSPMTVDDGRMTLAIVRDATADHVAGQAQADRRDATVQRLFGVAMALAALARSSPSPHTRTQLDRLADEVAVAIDDLGSSHERLGPPETATARDLRP